jgi:hypothetical protein
MDRLEAQNLTDVADAAAEILILLMKVDKWLGDARTFDPDGRC